MIIIPDIEIERILREQKNAKPQRVLYHINENIHNRVPIFGGVTECDGCDPGISAGSRDNNVLDYFSFRWRGRIETSSPKASTFIIQTYIF